MEIDVLIVGGRVGGATLGLLLSQKGYRVLIVERDRFPSDTMSTHMINAPAVPLLKQIGVIDDVLAAGFRRITRARVHFDDCIFDGPIAPGDAYGLAPRRDILDQILVDHAVAAGADFHDCTRAERLLEEDGRVVGAVIRTPGGVRESVRARVVVGADGKFSSVAKWVGAKTYHAVPAIRPSYYGHYLGLEPLFETAYELFLGGDQMGLIFPMRPDEDCIVLGLWPEDFDEFRTDPQHHFEERVRAMPWMEARMRNARLDGKIIGTKGIENYFRKPYGPGWALTGDAGYLKDPTTGLGIGDAIRQSIWLADALDAWFGGAEWEESLNQYQRTRDEIMMPAYRATIERAATHDPGPDTFAWIKAVMSSPTFSSALAYALPEGLPHLLSPTMMDGVRALATAFGANAEVLAAGRQSAVYG